MITIIADHQQAQAWEERQFRLCTSCGPPAGAGAGVGGETSGRAPAVDHQQAQAWEERLQAVHQLQTTSRRRRGRRDFRPCTSCRPPAGAGVRGRSDFRPCTNCRPSAGAGVGLGASGRAAAADHQQVQA